MTKSRLEQEINVDTGSLISDHKYEPKNPEEPWGLCLHCNMAEAAHKGAVEPYKPAAKRAKRERVPKGKGRPVKQGPDSNGKPA